MLINVKMPAIVGILTFMSMINKTSERLNKVGNRLACVVSSAGFNFIDFNCCNYRKLSRQMFRQVTGQKDTIHNNIFLSNYPVEIVSTFHGVFTSTRD